MGNFKNLSAAIFDMDGTIIDSEPLFKLIANRSASELGFSIDEKTYSTWVGLPRESLERAIVKSLGPKFPLEDFKRIFASNWISHTEESGISPKPGIPELLRRLSKEKIPLAVATSTPTEQAERSLRIAGIHDPFDIIIGGDQVGKGKPDPEIFLKAAQVLGYHPEECLAVEDSAIGVESAVAANMFTILVPDTVYPSNKIREVANFVIPSPKTACRVILAIFRDKSK